MRTNGSRECAKYPKPSRESGVSSTPRPFDSTTNAGGILDRPLEPVVGRRDAPTRWRAMTVEGGARAPLNECFGFNFQTTACSQTRLRDSRPDTPELCHLLPALFNQRAQGCRAPDPPAAARGVVVNTRVSHHGYTGKRPAFPAQWFNGLFRALPGDRALLPPSSTDCSANLTPASGRQDHTTSPSVSAPFVKSASASTASRPAAVTIACRPSVGRHLSIIIQQFQ